MLMLVNSMPFKKNYKLLSLLFFLTIWVSIPTLHKLHHSDLDTNHCEFCLHLDLSPTVNVNTNLNLFVKTEIQSSFNTENFVYYISFNPFNYWLRGPPIYLI